MQPSSISQETLLILKNMAGINKSIRINEGNELMIFNRGIPLFACAKVKDSFPQTFSIYDLGQWLSTISLFNEPVISYDNQNVVMSSGRMSAKYRMSAPSITADQPDRRPTLPAPTFSFSLRKEQLQEILKACSVLGLGSIQLSVNSIKAFNKNALGETLDNEYSTAIEDVVEEDSYDGKSVRINVSALKFLPLDYKVTVTPSMVVFKHESDEFDIEYYTGIIKDSK